MTAAIAVDAIAPSPVLVEYDLASSERRDARISDLRRVVPIIAIAIEHIELGSEHGAPRA